MSGADLVALVCCDLGAIVRGRSVLASDLDEHLESGIGWVPANHALTPLGPLAEPNPFGSTGDLRLLPAPPTQVRVGAGDPSQTPLEMILCDIVELDGSPWKCCPRDFLRRALADLQAQTGAILVGSFEHEFQLLGTGGPPPLPFSLEAMRAVEPFGADVMEALLEAGLEPERFFGEFASHQFEIPLAPAEGIAVADRAVLAREVVREVARRSGLRATFTPLLDPAEAGNGVHIHLSLRGSGGEPLLYDAERPGELSEQGGAFAAGILRHAGALCALCAPSPVSCERLLPHHWSAGAACLGERNRETLLRIPPLPSLAGTPAAAQMQLEVRAVDGAANPHIALGSLIRAGLGGIRDGLDAPPILDRDPATLEEQEARRFGVGALPGSLALALEALEADEEASAWLGPQLLSAHLSVKRAEIAACEELDLEATCARYASVY